MNAHAVVLFVQKSRQNILRHFIANQPSEMCGKAIAWTAETLCNKIIDKFNRPLKWILIKNLEDVSALLHWCMRRAYVDDDGWFVLESVVCVSSNRLISRSISKHAFFCTEFKIPFLSLTEQTFNERTFNRSKNTATSFLRRFSCEPSSGYKKYLWKILTWK